MKIPTSTLVLFLMLFLGSLAEPNEAVKTQIKIVDSNREAETEISQFLQNKEGVETKLATSENRVAADNGYGNPGDLIYRYRESNDKLQVREVIVLPEISSAEQEIQWYAVTGARRITSIRVLNFGRERAYAVRIDVAGNEVQTILRVPSNCDPRIMIEVYGI